MELTKQQSHQKEISKQLEEKQPINVVKGQLINAVKEQEEVMKIVKEPSRKLQILAISDTHGHYKQLDKLLEMRGDIFIHAGDFTYYSKDKDYIKFYEYLDKLQFKHKIVISGNHEIVLDNGCITPKKRQQYLQKYKCTFSKYEILQQLKKRCIYLEHQYIELEGVKIFASPYTPYFVGNAFQYNLTHEKQIWNQIPQHVDLLITHGPPYGILDETTQNQLTGSQYLKEISFKRKPKYHIFGHIHEAAGVHKEQGITFMNVSNSPMRIVM